PTNRADRVLAAAIAIGVLALWELASRQGWIHPLMFPPPTRIVADFAVLWHQDFARNVGLTLMRFFGGVVVGGIPGILFGLCIGWSPRLRRIADPFIAAIHP